MDCVIDFTGDPRAHVSFGGSDRKFGVIHDDAVYMLKFSERHAKQDDISTSYVNNVVSEYISSHIAQSVGLPAHDTVLGFYNEEIVVGCKDFRMESGSTNVEFLEYLTASYDSADRKRLVRLDQIYATLRDSNNAFPDEIQEASVRRYWDTFVVDAFVGNFDRHPGNWGYLVRNNSLKLAPLYDFGSTLLPQLSDSGAGEIIDDAYNLYKRCLIFPSPSLVITDEKVGKVGYYDMLASNYDSECSAAVLRIVPRIDLEKVRCIIEETPLITDVRKQFYIRYLSARKEVILDRAYVRCAYKDYDLDALQRLKSGHQFSEVDLANFLDERKTAYPEYRENQRLLDIAYSPEYRAKEALMLEEDRIDKKGLVLR